jgi:hypothetical protein
MRSEATMFLSWEVAPLYRRFQRGEWRTLPYRLLWWLWPVRWLVVIEDRGFTQTDYFCSANDAAVWMCEKCGGTRAAAAAGAEVRDG